MNAAFVGDAVDDPNLRSIHTTTSRCTRASVSGFPEDQQPVSDCART